MIGINDIELLRGRIRQLELERQQLLNERADGARNMNAGHVDVRRRSTQDQINAVTKKVSVRRTLILMVTSRKPIRYGSSTKLRRWRIRN